MLFDTSSKVVQSFWMLAGTGTCCRTCRSRAFQTSAMGDMSDDRVIALQEVTIPKGMEATTVKQIITHLFGLNSANVTQTFKIRNHKGCLIPFNSFIPVNSKHMPYVLEVATVFQHVIPKPRTIAMTVINKSMRTRLQGVVRRIVRLEELFPQIKLRRHEKIYQEIELLNQQLRFLHKRMQVSISIAYDKYRQKKIKNVDFLLLHIR
uniref:uncharacterized protein si:zfos-1056e6.1 isoform X1 n=1 Tax=Oncorhynchus gorbuscha TaxID=8017 RepID=UPI001EAE89CB|nr:uncharacterized protein si:zfos-1056e6.1 isoform X1 [Oncorhynchus gorbuscha]